MKKIITFAANFLNINLIKQTEMKKFLAFFAFAATIVFGAFALASCTTDDDEDVYKLVFELKTQNEKVRNSEQFAKYTKITSDLNEEYHCSENKASKIWDLLIENQNGLQEDLDNAAKALDDQTLSYTVKLLKNGQQWKFITLVTKYRKTSLDF